MTKPSYLERKKNLGSITYRENKGYLLEDGITIFELSTQQTFSSLQDWMKIIELREKGVLFKNETMEDLVFSGDDMPVFDDTHYFFP